MHTPTHPFLTDPNPPTTILSHPLPPPKAPPPPHLNENEKSGTILSATEWTLWSGDVTVIKWAKVCSLTSHLATEWMTISANAKLLFAIGIMESLVDLEGGGHRRKVLIFSTHCYYLSPVCKLQIPVSLSAMTKFMRSSSVAEQRPIWWV